MVSDFSAVHGIRDVTTLPGRVFLTMAWRLPCYPGAMRELVAALARPGTPTGPGTAPVMAAGVTEVPGTRAALQADPGLAQVFSFG